MSSWKRFAVSLVLPSFKQVMKWLVRFEDSGTTAIIFNCEEHLTQSLSKYCAIVHAI